MYYKQKRTDEKHRFLFTQIDRGKRDEFLSEKIPLMTPRVICEKSVLHKKKNPNIRETSFRFFFFKCVYYLTS